MYNIIKLKKKKKERYLHQANLKITRAKSDTWSLNAAVCAVGIDKHVFLTFIL